MFSHDYASPREPKSKLQRSWDFKYDHNTLTHTYWFLPDIDYHIHRLPYKNSLNIKINQLLNSITNKTIVFEWIPSHVDIQGNELADKIAKEYLNNRFIRRLSLNTDEFNSIVKKIIFKQWQTEWANAWKDSNNPCNLYKIKPTLGDWKSSYRDNRREEIVLSRLRTGWCRYLVEHRFQNQPQTFVPRNICNICRTTNTLEHLFLTCPKWWAFRIPIYSHIQRLRLPISLATILGEEFNHGILFRYLKDIIFFDIIQINDTYKCKPNGSCNGKMPSWNILVYLL